MDLYSLVQYAQKLVRLADYLQNAAVAIHDLTCPQL
jgi:hypothetical protein